MVGGLGDISIAGLGVGAIPLSEVLHAGLSASPIERGVHVLGDWGDLEPLADG